MHKLPEASDRKKGKCMRKEKKNLPTKRAKLISLSAIDQRGDNTLLTSGDATRSSLDDALASLFPSITCLG